MAMVHIHTRYGDISTLSMCKNEQEVACNASALVLVTEWKQFRFLDFAQLGATMTHRVLFDGRNQYRATDVAQYGFEYVGIGQKPHSSR